MTTLNNGDFLMCLMLLQAGRIEEIGSSFRICAVRVVDITAAFLRDWGLDS